MTVQPTLQLSYHSYWKSESIILEIPPVFTIYLCNCEHLLLLPLNQESDSQLSHEPVTLTTCVFPGFLSVMHEFPAAQYSVRHDSISCLVNFSVVGM
jgi:hypothetical protein